MLTNAIANAGLSVGWNIWNLYIHLCWLTVEQQFIPALAIASAVGSKFKTLGKRQTISNLKHFLLVENLNRQKLGFDKAEFQTRQFLLFDSTISARQFRIELLGENSPREFFSRQIWRDKFGATFRLDGITRQLLQSWQKFLDRLSMNFSCQLRI